MMKTDVKLVHMIFKTHLDVGFTDYASRIIDKYIKHFIPDAINLARDFRDNHPDEPFCWTVGSWLIYEYLKHASHAERQSMEEAITDGIVTWHALPFTTHTEAMDEDLFRYGLSLSNELDERFGRKTIAGKMTDVPGHTRAMIPLLDEAGIRFFHVGVNPAATVPDVPPLFKWVDEGSGTSVLVMYQQVYGDVMILPGTSEAAALVFTGDNLGPPSKTDIHKTYVDLREQFPNAKFIGSTLDAVARSLIAANPQLPVVSAEIGDTWIQGIGTDPTKVSQYRELLRLRQRWMRDKRIDTDTLKRLHEALIMIPEHTWGMDLKSHLNDYDHYDTRSLAQARSLPNFRKFEASWHEQRNYVTSALNALDNSPLKAEAEQHLHHILPHKPNLSHYRLVSQNQFESENWLLHIDTATGAINHLIHTETKRLLADNNHPLSQFMYETFSTSDYDRYWQQYIRDREFGETRVWAHPDNTKPHLQVAEHQTWHPIVQNIYQRRDQEHKYILIEATLPRKSQHIGAPQIIFFEYILGERLEIVLRWFDKPACRLPEAYWLSFNPIVQLGGNWAIHKLGSRINPTDVVSKGARTLHGISDGVSYETTSFRLYLASLDAPLVAPDEPSLLNFSNKLPTMTGGLHFNLYNNVWGTNFPMWFEDDALFRFSLSLSSG